MEDREVRKNTVLKFPVGTHEDMGEHFGHALENRGRFEGKWARHFMLP